MLTDVLLSFSLPSGQEDEVLSLYCTNFVLFSFVYSPSVLFLFFLLNRFVLGNGFVEFKFSHHCLICIEV